MQTKLLVILALALVMAVPMAGSGSAQIGNSTGSEIKDLVNNSTDHGNNSTDTISPTNNSEQEDDSPFVTDTSGLGATNIMINEAELNPQGSDSGKEWIELYNPTAVEVNVSGFEITTSFKSATVQLPSDAVIDANGTYLVELDSQMLSNTAESLVLSNSSGEVVDRTPSLVDKNDDGWTWQRIPDGNDEWKFAQGTRDELNDPEEHSSAYAARSSSAAQCLGVAGCAEGTVRRIVDGDTLWVRVNDTDFKIDLALATAPSSMEQGYIDARLFTQSLCLGTNVLIDQDDKLLTSDTSVIAVVFCASTNLNSELLDNGYATLNAGQCKTSEFGSQPWAKEHGC